MPEKTRGNSLEQQGQNRFRANIGLDRYAASQKKMSGPDMM
jgi:hypothetical protein